MTARFVLTALCALLAAVWARAEEPKLLYEQDPTSLVSTIQVAVLSGSTEDPLPKIGLSNLYSELMLRGSKKFDRSRFQSTLEKMGATLSVGAYHDRVVFYGRVIKENTFEFLSLLEECLLYPSFPKNEFDALKIEILNGINHLKNSNNRLGGLVLRREIFKGTPLEKPVPGGISTVSAIEPADVVRAYNNAFHRANIVFAVASPFSEEQWKKPLKDIWMKLPDGAQRARRVSNPIIPLKPTLVVIHKPKTSTGVLSFAQAGITAQDPLRYTLTTGNFSYGGEPLVSRLFRTIRGELGWTYAINSGFSAMGSLSFQPGLYTIASTPSVEFTAKTLFKTLESWHDYMDNGLKKDEMILAQESIVNSYPFEFESAEKRLAQKLHSYLYGVPILSQEEFSKTIHSISNGDLKKALKERHTRNGWVIALVADKDIVEKQLEEEQKDTPEEKRIKITKVFSPDEVVQ